jgi:hypothetical protein
MAPYEHVDASREQLASGASPPASVRRRRLLGVVAAAGVIAAGGAAMLYARAEDAPAAPVLPPREPPAAIDAPPVPAFTPRPGAPAQPAAVTDTPASARVVKRTLRVTAPPGAQILVNGRPVGRNPWYSDAITARTYTIAASIPNALPGCPSAREERQVTVPAASRRQVDLAPRPCGTIQILIRAEDKTMRPRYQLTQLDGDAANPALSGTIRPNAPLALVVPVGRWRLALVDLPAGCTPFTGEYQVEERKAQNATATTLCGP